MFVGVENKEKRNATYVIETWILNTTFEPSTNTTRINSMEPGDSFSLSLAGNETAVLPYSLQVRNLDCDRVAFLLFNDKSPGPQVTGSDRIKASYRDLYLHVSVREAFYQEGNSEIT
jgi:uncharacterized membrane protein